jgi:hypothetical protein
MVSRKPWKPSALGPVSDSEVVDVGRFEDESISAALNQAQQGASEALRCCEQTWNGARKQRKEGLERDNEGW